MAGLYNASSATHAGGGVCGIPGLQASRAAIKDAKARRRSPRRLLAGRRPLMSWQVRPGCAGCSRRGRWRCVGASERPDSLRLADGDRGAAQPGIERAWLVNPGRDTVLGQPCVPSLADVPEPVDLVLLGVPDTAAAPAWCGWRRSAATRARSSSAAAHGLRDEIWRPPRGLEICGGGCMGFVNVSAGVRAIGYLERDPLPAGPIALVTHSGSVFSAMLRTHRRLEYSLAVSSGQELVTTTADYLAYALSLPETRVVGLVLETMRDADRAGGRPWRDAAERDIPVVALTVGGSTRGRDLVDAHSGAIAGSDAALGGAVRGVRRAPGRRPRASWSTASSASRSAGGYAVAAGGIATVHDSGAERVLAADVAEALGVPFAPLSEGDRASDWAALLDPGLEPTNPLDVWGAGPDTEDTASPTAWSPWPTTTRSTWWRWRSTWCRSTTATSRFPQALDRLVDARPTSPSPCCRTSPSAIDQPLAADLCGTGGSRSSRGPAPGCGRWDTCCDQAIRAGPPRGAGGRRGAARALGGAAGARRGRRPRAAAATTAIPVVDDVPGGRRDGGDGRGGDAGLAGRAQDRRHRRSTTSSTSTASGWAR